MEQSKKQLIADLQNELDKLDRIQGMHPNNKEYKKQQLLRQIEQVKSRTT